MPISDITGGMEQKEFKDSMAETLKLEGAIEAIKQLIELGDIKYFNLGVEKDKDWYNYCVKTVEYFITDEKMKEKFQSELQAAVDNTKKLELVNAVMQKLITVCNEVNPSLASAPPPPASTDARQAVLDSITSDPFKALVKNSLEDEKYQV